MIIFFCHIIATTMIFFSCNFSFLFYLMFFLFFISLFFHCQFYFYIYFFLGCRCFFLFILLYFFISLSFHFHFSLSSAFSVYFAIDIFLQQLSDNKLMRTINFYYFALIPAAIIASLIIPVNTQRPF